MAILQSLIYFLSGLPVGSQVQNQQKFFDPDDSSQSATAVGSFPSFGIHRWQDRWLDVRNVAEFGLEVIQLSLVQMNLCKQCSTPNVVLVRWAHSSVGGQSFFLNKCDLIADAKLLLLWRKLIETYFQNLVINTIRHKNLLSFSPQYVRLKGEFSLALTQYIPDIIRVLFLFPCCMC